MEKDYQQLLDYLHAGKIENFEISTEEFMAFQKVLMAYNYRKNIIGIAKRGGGVRYHYKNEG